MKQLYYNLIRPKTSFHDAYPLKIRDIGPWVSLIGRRYSSSRTIDPIRKGDEYQSPDETFLENVKGFKCLLCILSLPRLVFEYENADRDNQGIFWGDILTIGQLLDYAYQQGVLSPEKEDSYDDLEDNVMYLILTLGLASIWRRPSHVYALASEGMELRSFNSVRQGSTRIEIKVIRQRLERVLRMREFSP